MANTKSQIEKFRETARSLECDENEENFDAALGKIARHKPVKPDLEKLKKLMESDDPENFDKIAKEIGNKED